MPVHQGHDVDGVLARMRGYLAATFADAAESAQSMSRAVGLVPYFVGLRARLGDALAVLREGQSLEDDELVLREAQLEFVRRRDRFHHAESRATLLREWNALLVDAAAKVARDRRDAALYANAGAADDDEWYAGTERATGERWASE